MRMEGAGSGGDAGCDDVVLQPLSHEARISWFVKAELRTAYATRFFAVRETRGRLPAFRLMNDDKRRAGASPTGRAEACPVATGGSEGPGPHDNGGTAVPGWWARAYCRHIRRRTRPTGLRAAPRGSGILLIRGSTALEVAGTRAGACAPLSQATFDLAEALEAPSSRPASFESAWNP